MGVLGLCCMGTNFPLLVPGTITTHRYSLPFLTSVVDYLYWHIKWKLKQNQNRARHTERSCEIWQVMRLLWTGRTVTVIHMYSRSDSSTVNIRIILPWILTFAIWAWMPVLFRAVTAFWAAVGLSKSTNPYPEETGSTLRKTSCTLTSQLS